MHLADFIHVHKYICIFFLNCRYLYCFRSLHPTKYYRDYLAHDVRPDGREISNFRPVIVNIGSITTADGSAIAKVGKTSVVCGIKLVNINL